MEKNSEKLGVLISVYGEGMQSVVEKVLPTLDLSIARPIINHQRSDLYTGSIPTDPAITYLKSDSVGLSSSRNECLHATPYEVNVICDDDVVYEVGFEKKVLRAFAEHPADIITFQRREKVTNSKGIKEHTRLSLFMVSSITIALKKNSIISSGVSFDTCFGLGAETPMGEENIFLDDCYKKGLTILNSPEVIVSHPHLSSGYIASQDFYRNKIRVFRRIFGNVKGLIVLVFFFAKKKLF